MNESLNVALALRRARLERHEPGRRGGRLQGRFDAGVASRTQVQAYGVQAVPTGPDEGSIGMTRTPDESVARAPARTLPLDDSTTRAPAQRALWLDDSTARLPAPRTPHENSTTRAPAASAWREDSLSWVPEACTLQQSDRPFRAAEFDELFGRSLRGLARPEPTLLGLTLDGSQEVESTSRELVAREVACCSFFDFTLTRRPDDTLLLEVRVPEGQTRVLDGLVARAAAATGGRSA
jgi:hypothetical protein